MYLLHLGYLHIQYRIMDNFISACDFDCRKCKVYVASQNNDLSVLKETLEEIKNKTNRQDLQLNDIYCDGCLNNKRLFYYCSECDIRNKDKGE